MEAAAILDFARRVGALKNLPRTGWLLRGVRGGESVADHAYRTTHLAMLLADALPAGGARLDTERVLRMAQLHEIGEAVIGDLPSGVEASIPAEVKSRLEEQAVASLTKALGAVGERYRQLWREFEDGLTAEARLVKAADKLEMLIQAWEYESHGATSLDEFWGAADAIGGEPLLEEIVDLLRDSRTGRGAR